MPIPADLQPVPAPISARAADFSRDAEAEASSKGGSDWLPFLVLLRPQQWTKNLFCFAGLIFGGRALDLSWGLAAITTFCAFCGVSSCVYIFNDYLDRHNDAAHPRKRKRPLASGAVSVGGAATLATLSLLVAIGFGLAAGETVLRMLAIYFVLNLAYTLWLKHIVLLDVMIISVGFMLRIFAGNEAVQVPTSAWMVTCMLFLALFLGFAKRRAEMRSLEDACAKSRAVLQNYSVALLDRYCTICSTLAIACYALFTMSPTHQHSLVITCPAVIFGLFRYLHLMEQKSSGEAPDAVILTDMPLQAAGAVWLGLCVAVLYFGLDINIQ